MPGFFVGGPGGHASIEKQAGSIVEVWYLAFNQQDYNALLSLFPDNLFQKVSREQMAGIFTSYRTKLGALKSRKIHFSKENHSNGESAYILQYASSYENGDSKDTFHIVRASPSDPLKITKVEFDSAALKR